MKHVALRGLSPEEVKVLARVRLATTVHSAALASRSGSRSPREGPRKAFLPGAFGPGPRSRRDLDEGRLIRAWSGGAPMPAQARRLPQRRPPFSSPRAAARALGGGGGVPDLPIPLGLGALAAISCFPRGRSPRSLSFCASHGTDPGSRPPFSRRPRSGASRRSRRPTPPSTKGWHTCRRLGRRRDCRGVLDRPGQIGAADRCPRVGPERPNARLLFRDAAAAIAVFTGARPAVVALGAGEVTIGGLLSLVQGLFAVLDRLGAYMAVKCGSRGHERQSQVRALA